MGNAPFYRRLVRRLTKNSSGTLSVTIPIEHVASLGWQKGKAVVVERRDNQIIIRPASKTRN